jgi:hypothetical protein
MFRCSDVPMFRGGRCKTGLIQDFSRLIKATQGKKFILFRVMTTQNIAEFAAEPRGSGDLRNVEKLKRQLESWNCE